MQREVFFCGAFTIWLYIPKANQDKTEESLNVCGSLTNLHSPEKLFRVAKGKMFYPQKSLVHIAKLFYSTKSFNEKVQTNNLRMGEAFLILLYLA